jgi:uncharacterized membrane protein YccC
MPLMFALGDKVIGDPGLATFAAFGTFAMLLLVDFGGPMRERLQSQASLAVTGAVFVCVGTLASQNIMLATVSMAVVGFCVLFAGVVSSVLAAATTSLLLAFILPVTLPGSPSQIPARLIGWALASVASFAAVALLWPAPAREPLRSQAVNACRVLAVRLRADVEYVLGGRREQDRTAHQAAVENAAAAVAGLRKTFLATPYRPTGLSTSARTIVRLVDELNWLDAILAQSADPARFLPPNRAACAVKTAAAAALGAGADLLEAGGAPHALHQSLRALTDALDAMEKDTTVELPVDRPTAEPDPRPGETLISSLDPVFRAQELSFAVVAIVSNIDLTVAAERRGWRDRLLGRQPGDLVGRSAAAWQRAAAHLDRHSVWLHNAIRGAFALGLAVFLAELTGVQHSFWVVLAALSVLRSNALSTGQNALRGLLGTVAGFVVGAGVLALIGTNTVALWVVLPVAILFAGLAPAVATFLVGQAAFTLVVVILFNIIVPVGWRVGLLRVEDIALGCAVSLVVGLLFWPRGAGAALGTALAEAYRDCADYLGAAVAFGMLRCDPQVPTATAPKDIAERAAGASRRLDDTFRSYLAERGSKPVPLSAATRLVTGVVALRLAGDAVLNLWERDNGKAGGDRTAARREVLQAAGTVTRWFTEFGESFARGGVLPDPLPYDPSADQRLVEAVQHDLRGDDGRANATAVRMIWTEDHLDAARRLQSAVVEPARVALANRADETLGHLFSGGLHGSNPAAREIPTAEAAGTASR